MKISNIIPAIAATLMLGGCAVYKEQPPAHMNMPDDRAYFSPNSSISPVSIIRVRKVEIQRMAEAEKIESARDDQLYRNAEDQIRSLGPKIVDMHCSFIDKEKQTPSSGEFFLDLKGDAVFFGAAKANGQMLLKAFTGGLAAPFQDSEKFEVDAYLYDQDNNLVAKFMRNPEISSGLHTAGATGGNLFGSGGLNQLVTLNTIASVSSLCGMMKSSYTALHKGK